MDLDLFVEAANAGPVDPFAVDFPQCQELTAVEAAKATSSEPSLHTQTIALLSLCARGARPGGFNKGQGK